MIASIVSAACGAVLLLAALAVLKDCRSREMSLRALAGALIWVAGAWLLARAPVDPPALPDLLLPLGVTLLILVAVHARRGHPMRRLTDWLPPPGTGGLES